MQGRRERKGRKALVEKTRNKVKTNENSFCQVLFLFLSSKVLLGFSIIPFGWQLPTSSCFSFLIPLHQPFPSSNTRWKMVAVTEPAPSKARAAASWVIPPASWKLLKQGTATRCSGVFPCYAREKHCKDGCYSGNNEYWRGTICHQDNQTNNVPGNWFI